MNTIAAMGIGFFLDCLLGDPYSLPHPIRWIGTLIGWLDRLLHKEKQQKKGLQVFLGGLLVLLVLFLTGISVWGIRRLSQAAPLPVSILVDGVLFYYCIAPRSLCTESMAVYQALPELTKARKQLSYIVGRDTQALSEEGIVKAAVETVAENTSDGVTAPMFYMALGGPLLCFLYKAVNTMDSMLGYHNEAYEYFGKAAARLDDVWNYVPARLTAWCMAVSAFLLTLLKKMEQKDPGGDAEFSRLLSVFDYKRGIRIYRRDRRRHKSPNSAQTESMCAGALGVELAGDASYFGKVVSKPVIGDAERKIEREDIRRANWLMYITGILFLLGMMQFHIWLQYLW